MVIINKQFWCKKPKHLYTIRNNVLLESEKLSKIKKNKGLIKMVNNFGLENKYFTWKQMREKAEKDIAKMEDLDVENMT